MYIFNRGSNRGWAEILAKPLSLFGIFERFKSNSFSVQWLHPLYMEKRPKWHINYDLFRAQPFNFKFIFACRASGVSRKTHLSETCCRVPARWGLQQTTLALDSDKTWTQGSFAPLKFEKDGPYTGPVLLRQGEPGTSQYTDIKAQGSPPWIVTI